MTQENFLICLVGLPSSGKSTFAKSLRFALKDRYNNLKVIIIDPDIIRHNLTGEKFDYNKEYIIRNQNLKTIRSELEKGNIVISDNLNYYSSMRHDLKEIADSLNLCFFIVHVSTPPEICIKWNEKRGKPIPNIVINRIYSKFDEFNKYNWDYPLAKYNLSEIPDINIAIKEFLSQVDEKLKKSLKKEKSLIVSNLNNENLDKITRIYIRELLLDPKNLGLKKSIIKLRKNYVKENKNIIQTEIEIYKTFKEYLQKNLR